MASVTIQFDTVTKELSAAVDGSAVPDVSSVSIYRYYGEDNQYTCEIGQSYEDEATKMWHSHRMCASTSTQGAEALKKGEASVSKLSAEFVTIDGGSLNKVQADVAAYFSGK